LNRLAGADTAGPDTAGVDTFDAVWRSLAEQIAAGPLLAQRIVKENVNRALESDLRTCLDYEAYTTVALMQSADHAEAKRAFAERRPPRFTGV
jgi:2-(1,2-epoxy-1,2-dihydrophenyl)acetyl-CoA isomerase